MTARPEGSACCWNIAADTVRVTYRGIVDEKLKTQVYDLARVRCGE